MDQTNSIPAAVSEGNPQSGYAPMTSHRRTMPMKTSLFTFRNVSLLASLLTLPFTAPAQLNYATPYTFVTLVGNGPNRGVDGTGSAARFRKPSGLGVDSEDNLYVLDDTHRVRKVTPAGVVTTLAGLADVRGSADGTGSAARFNYPWGLAVDGAGNIYVGDGGNKTLRKVTSEGVVTTLAGLVGNPGSTDGTGSAARFFLPWDVAVDSVGNVYVVEAAQTIRKVTPNRVVTTLAGDVSRNDQFGNSRRP